MANRKCTPSDRQIYPYGYMYPRVRTSDLLYLRAVSCPYSTATRYELAAQLSLWEGLQVVYLINIRFG